MPRPLRPDERALWRRITRDVRRLGAGAEPDGGEEVAAPPVAAPRPAAAAGPVAVARPPARPRPRAAVATLDGGWDKRLREGQVAPDRLVDLHGCTLASAHRRLDEAVETAVRAGDRLVVLVTGKPPRPGSSRADLPLRGIIRASVEDWLAASPHAAAIAAVRPAHARHGGAGALYIIFRRRRAPG